MDVTPHLARLVSRLRLTDGGGLFQSGDTAGANNAPSAAANKAGRGTKPAAPADRLVEWQELVLGQLLASYAYAVAIGDPDSTMLLAGDPADVHDFGVGASGRSSSWLVAKDERVGSQSVERGSILGLERALSVPSLRQTTLAAPSVAPNIGAAGTVQGSPRGLPSSTRSGWTTGTATRSPPTCGAAGNASGRPRALRTRSTRSRLRPASSAGVAA